MNPKKGAQEPKVHKELEGFDININSFGEISTSYDIGKLNNFLDKNVEDKKLVVRDDYVGPRVKYKLEDADEEEGEFSEEDLIAEHDVLVMITERGYVKRMLPDTYRTQHRGGRESESLHFLGSSIFVPYFPK